MKNGIGLSVSEFIGMKVRNSEMGSRDRGVSYRCCGRGEENRIWSEVDIEVLQVRITSTIKGELGYEISTGRRGYTGVKIDGQCTEDAPAGRKEPTKLQKIHHRQSAGAVGNRIPQHKDDGKWRDNSMIPVPVKTRSGLFHS